MPLVGWYWVHQVKGEQGGPLPWIIGVGWRRHVTLHQWRDEDERGGIENENRRGISEQNPFGVHIELGARGRIKFLVEQAPGPECEMHPSLAGRLGLVDRQIVTVETRRGKLTVPLRITEAIRRDTVFVPYHWAERLSANQLTVHALDPVSRMPEFKVAACRVRTATKDEAAQLRRDYAVLKQEAGA